MFRRILHYFCINLPKSQDDLSVRYSNTVSITLLLSSFLLTFSLLIIFDKYLYTIFMLSYNHDNFTLKEGSPVCESLSSVSNEGSSDAVEINVEAPVTVEYLRETIRNVCDRLDESNSVDLSLCNSEIQTDWKLIWWKDLDNFDEVHFNKFISLSSKFLIF